MVEIAQRILPAGVDSAGIADGVAQQRAALLGDDFAGNDLHAGGQVPKLGSGLAERWDLLRRWARRVVVRTVSGIEHAGGLRRGFWRLVGANRSSPYSRFCGCRSLPWRRTIFGRLDLHRRQRRG